MNFDGFIWEENRTCVNFGWWVLMVGPTLHIVVFCDR